VNNSDSLNVQSLIDNQLGNSIVISLLLLSLE